MKFFKQSVKLVLFTILFIWSNKSEAQMFWNQTCEFAGTSSSYIAAPSSSSINLTSSFTLEAWVRPTAVTGIERGIISKGSTLGASLRYALKINTTGRVTISTNGILRATSVGVLAVNTWTHVSASYNAISGLFTIYLNGVSNATATVGGADPSTNSDSLHIGIAGAGAPFSGQLDDVRIWSRTLSTTEIAQFYRSNLAAGGPTYSLLGLSYTFQKENSGGTTFTLKDWSGNNNNGFNRSVNGISQTNLQYNTIGPNEALTFDGTQDYVSGPSNSLVSPTSSISIEAWVYPRAVATAPVLISKNSATSYMLGLSASGKIQFYPRGGAPLLESKSLVSLNRWVHIAATYSGTATAIYVNGKLDTLTSTITGAIGSNSDSLFIGCNNTGGGPVNHLNGILDEVRICNYAKTETQINNYMFRSIDSVNQPNPASNNVSYNFDGYLEDNSDGGPSLNLRFDAKFTHPAATANQFVSPLLRNDAGSFSEGFLMRQTNKRLPATGGTGLVEDTLIVPYNVTINDINLFVAVNHSDETNLDITLVGPNGQTVDVSTDNALVGVGDNYVAILDDQAPNAVNNATFTSFMPAVRPEINLGATFNGDFSQGIWRLRINDDGGTADTGRMYGWGIQFNNSSQANRLTSLNLTALIQGFWDGAIQPPDTVRVYLRNTVSPYTITDSGKTFLNNAGNGTIAFLNTGTATKYITVKHRNTIDTWSATGVAFQQDSTKSYNFTTAASQAFGNNQIFKLGKFCMYNGDPSRDGTIDLTDIIAVFNDAGNFVVGYVPTDINGDNFVDLTDLTTTFNNANNFVTVVTPP